MAIRNQDLLSLVETHVSTISTDSRDSSLRALNRSVSNPIFGEDELAFITAYQVHINNLDLTEDS